MPPEFEWDDDKEALNRAKHGIDFDEAGTALDDPWVMERLDEAHTGSEARWRALGRTTLGRLLVVVFTERADRIRLISARPATRREQREYDEH